MVWVARNKQHQNSSKECIGESDGIYECTSVQKKNLVVAHKEFLVRQNNKKKFVNTFNSFSQLQKFLSLFLPIHTFIPPVSYDVTEMGFMLLWPLKGVSLLHNFLCVFYTTFFRFVFMKLLEFFSRMFFLHPVMTSCTFFSYALLSI